MFELIYGLSGSGKTHLITERIAEDVKDPSRNVFLIVPEQLVLSTERRMLSVLPSSAQLNFHVLSFSRLANLVFRKHGGLTYNYVTPAVEIITAWRAVKESLFALNEFGEVGIRDESFPITILNVIKELKLYGITPDALDKAIESIENDGTAQSTKKLKDISLLYSLYENIIKEGFTEGTDDLTKLDEKLAAYDFFNGASVYFDAFVGYTPKEFRIIERIIKGADKVAITLCIDKPSSSMPQFATAAETAVRLRRLIRENLNGRDFKEYILKDNKRARSANLAYLSENLWRYDLGTAERDEISRSSDKDGAIELYKCHDAYSEADMIAGFIKKHIEMGYRYKDIAVIFRDASTRIGILDTALEKHGVPHYMSQKSDLISKPITKLILSAVRIYVFNYNLNDVISFFKTGLLGYDPLDISFFEDYCHTWRIRGKAFLREFTMNPDGYKREMSDRAANILRQAEGIRSDFAEKSKAFCAMLSEAHSGADICSAIYALLTDLNITERLEALARKAAGLGFDKEADETLQLYNAVIRALSDIAGALGDTAITPKDFLGIFKLVMSATEIGTIPTSQDQVTIGSANTLRLNDIKIAFVCGLCEGEFPKNVSESSLISDNDKHLLLQKGIELSADCIHSTSDELFYAYNALSVPSDRLILSTTEFNNELAPSRASSVFKRVKYLLPDAEIKVYETLPPSQRIFTPAAALDHLAHSDKGPEDGSLRAALLSTEGYQKQAEMLDRDIENDVLFTSEETRSLVFGNKIRLDQSKIEKYIGCRLSYYCTYVLSLRSHGGAKFSSNDIGTFVHFMMENTVRYLQSRYSLTDSSLSEEEINGAINIMVESFVSENYAEEYTNSGRLRHLVEKMRRLASLMIHGLISEFKDSDFIPRFYELNIGDMNAPPSIELSLKNKKKVVIGGKADRVDVYSAGDDIYIRVVDYKTGSKTFSLSDISTGHNLQTLLYLFAICNNGAKEWKRHLMEVSGICGDEQSVSIKPASAIYISSKISTLHPQNILPESDICTLAADSFTRRGVSTDNIDILTALSHSLSKKIIPGGVPKKKDKSGGLLLSDDDFSALSESINDVIKKISEDMLTGNTSSRAFLKEKDDAPDVKNVCAYCDMRAVCRKKAANLKDNKSDANNEN